MHEDLETSVQLLRESERNFRAFIENSPVAIVVVIDMRIIYANKKATEKSEYPKAELEGLSFADLIAPSDLEMAYDKWRRRETNTNPDRTFEISIVTRTGKVILLSLFYTDVIWEGKPAYIYLLNDITEKRKAELELKKQERLLEQIVAERTRELMEAKEKAEKADRLKTEFLANISHELRTPMHAILSYSRYGYEKFDRKSGQQLKEFFRNIFTNGNRLMGLLNDLLDLSQLQANRTNYHMQRWNFRGLLEELRSEFAMAASEKNLSWRIGDLEDAELVFDADKIKQVLSNLLSNALKFSADCSTIDIDVKHADDELLVTIRDQGVSIPPQELESVFDPFVQSSATRTGAGGTGLGLAICRKIIEDHGGRIWAEHDPDGATFKFTLKKRR